MYSTHRSLTAVHTILLRNDDLCPIGRLSPLPCLLTSPSCWGTHFLYLSNPPSVSFLPILLWCRQWIHPPGGTPSRCRSPQPMTRTQSAGCKHPQSNLLPGNRFCLLTVEGDWWNFTSYHSAAMKMKLKVAFFGSINTSRLVQVQ